MRSFLAKIKKSGAMPSRAAAAQSRRIRFPDFGENRFDGFLLLSFHIPPFQQHPCQREHRCNPKQATECEQPVLPGKHVLLLIGVHAHLHERISGFLLDGGLRPVCHRPAAGQFVEIQFLQRARGHPQSGAKHSARRAGAAGCRAVRLSPPFGCRARSSAR